MVYYTTRSTCQALALDTPQTPRPPSLSLPLSMPLSLPPPPLLARLGRRHRPQPKPLRIQQLVLVPIPLISGRNGPSPHPIKPPLRRNPRLPRPRLNISSRMTPRTPPRGIQMASSPSRRRSGLVRVKPGISSVGFYPLRFCQDGRVRRRAGEYWARGSRGCLGIWRRGRGRRWSFLHREWIMFQS